MTVYAQSLYKMLMHVTMALHNVQFRDCVDTICVKSRVFFLNNVPSFVYYIPPRAAPLSFDKRVVLGAVVLFAFASIALTSLLTHTQAGQV